MEQKEEQGKDKKVNRMRKQLPPMTDVRLSLWLLQRLLSGTARRHIPEDVHSTLWNTVSFRSLLLCSQNVDTTTHMSFTKRSGLLMSSAERNVTVLTRVQTHITARAQLTMNQVRGKIIHKAKRKY
jgi:hypothetical protein